MTGRYTSGTLFARKWRRACILTVVLGLGAGVPGSAQVTTKGGGPLAPAPMSTAALTTFGVSRAGMPTVSAKQFAATVPLRDPGTPFGPGVVPVQFTPTESITPRPGPQPAVLPPVTPGQLASAAPKSQLITPTTQTQAETPLAQKVVAPQPIAKAQATAPATPNPRVAPPLADAPPLPFNAVAMQPMPMRAPGLEQPRPMPMAPAAAGAGQPGAAGPAVGGPAAAAAGQPAGEALSAPRPLFPEDRVRLNRMDGPVGTTPVPTAKTLEEIGKYVDTVIDPMNTLDVIEGRARLVILKSVPTQFQVVDPTLIAANQLNDPKQFSILGRRTGTTVLNLWFTDVTDPKKEKIISYLVRVLPDPEAKARLERVYKALETEINKFFPNSRVRLTLVGDKLMVSGQAHDSYDATQILRIVRANAPGGGGGSAGQAQRANVLNIGATGGNPLDPTNPTGTPGQESYLLEANPNVINNLRIPGEQQVLLRVTVAEVNRAAARSIGVNFSVINNRGLTVFNQLTGGLAGAGNLLVNLDGGQIPIAINALRTMNYARSLAEPNLTALNGQTANFQAGGQFPVPVLGGIGGGGLQGVQFVPFGVQLQFTPFITDRDRIRLTMNATVSTRDNAAGANIGGAGVPGLNSRNFSTTVEMREGQTMAVAGLIQNNLAAETSRVPFLGDLPYVGRLLGLDRVQNGEQELVVLVTPELVHPLNQNELTPLPGSDIFEPGDLEFYLKGRLESRRSYDYRSAVRTDIDRMLSYRRCEQQFITGPTGHQEGVFNRPVTAPAAGK
jgi:pilus assembly protein CpaC